jgi:hypothetical protein
MTRRSKTSRQQKIDWLLAHQHIWTGYPKENSWKHARAILSAMIAAGLYSPRTNLLDAGLCRLISAARKTRRAA